MIGTLIRDIVALIKRQAFGMRGSFDLCRPGSVPFVSQHFSFHSEHLESSSIDLHTETVFSALHRMPFSRTPVCRFFRFRLCFCLHSVLSSGTGALELVDAIGATATDWNREANELKARAESSFLRAFVGNSLPLSAICWSGSAVSAERRSPSHGLSALDEVPNVTCTRVELLEHPVPLLSKLVP